MGSSRLPGKVLADIAGMPALVLQIRRLRRAHLDVAVATSEAPADDVVADLVGALGVTVVRGPEQDVLERYRLAAVTAPSADPIVRLTADCPLTDPDVVRRAVEVHQRTSADHTSNVLARTYPDGLDVEAISRAALLAAAAEAVVPEEREHVTPFLIRRPERFTLASFCSGVQAGLLRLVLDTAADLVSLRAAVARAQDPVAAAWHEFVALPTPPSGVSAWPRCSDGVLRARSFSIVREGEVIGTATVTVNAGVGHLALAVPPEAARDAYFWIERWLQLDLQVATLT